MARRPGRRAALANEGKLDAARVEVDGFHHRLCQVRVLDPACGSANFLYVTLEHMKRLEGEVLDQLQAFGAGQERLEAAGLTVDPQQFLGIELNPRAAAIAELVLWIGYLQWHSRTQGSGLPPQPIIKDFHNIGCRDVVLACDGVETVVDENGRPVSRWAGVTTKIHPVTGERARVPLERYLNPRKAEWPPADFIVGNPPLIGDKRIRLALGDGYVATLRQTWKEVPESVEFVMYWWHHAAQLVTAAQARRFGFITTNSLRQTFNRRIVESALDQGLFLAFAIPDHPWVDSADGAAVRIAMTVGTAGGGEGRLLTVIDEREGTAEGLKVTLTEQRGLLHADLRADELRSRYPAVFQHLWERVKPERDQDNRPRLHAQWWIFAEPRKTLRAALVGLGRYIATGETAKHRTFQFLDATVAPDHKLIAIASGDAWHLGVLSASTHIAWALATGARLGVGNDPVYNKSRRFDPFPFPTPSDAQAARIRNLAEQLDAHRKRCQSQHTGPTLTGLYNVLEKLHSGEMLNAKDKVIHEQGLVSVLKSLHDELDAAVIEPLRQCRFPKPNSPRVSSARTRGSGA